MSEEYMRRHYGVVSPTGEAPRLSTPENLAKRTGALTQSPDVPVKQKREKPPETMIISETEAPLNLSLGWTKRKASGKRTVKTTDYMVVDDENPQLLL